jgi:hypothetical protein
MPAPRAITVAAYPLTHNGARKHMSRAVFLMVAACIAVIVDAIAICFPVELLASKGAVPSVAANLWVREVGVLLVAIGVMV